MIDPISAYLGGVDSHKNSDVRALLMELDDIADKHRVAILCVTHLNKDRGGSAMSRFMGSTAFIAAARAGYLVTRDDGDSVTRRLWTTTKNNLAPDEYATAFDVEGATVDSMAGPISTSRVVWTGERLSITANEALAAGEEPDGGDSPAQEAEAFLLAVLAGGPKSSNAIRKDALGAGISWRTIERAKKRLGIKAIQSSGLTP